MKDVAETKEQNFFTIIRVKLISIRKTESIPIGKLKSVAIRKSKSSLIRRWTRKFQIAVC